MDINEQRMLALGERIKFIRTARGLTQAEVAESAKVSRVRMSQIESGTANPSFLMLCAIADALSTEVSSLTCIIYPLPGETPKPKPQRKPRTKRPPKKTSQEKPTIVVYNTHPTPTFTSPLETAELKD
ncbi:helix-turn-helix transcriptional regulator [Vibrio parahaemolyticus]|uniref:Helix-turn-helix transcriptional regulator n=1 Tax=Vibrio parahaemolyticus TaxID=670 RepID=A0A9Q3UGZ4_VIBPH|nr:helix-turn-helix transcriptional regulator [Vibrio parahaemolyticus]EGQ8101934.1 helix-turn-helix transcriptional regulator [Vibrio parahaemolyticus]EGQ8548719.1 helix-turn-helix domain-containing protein [Vibrio parahaemolyticus]EGQ9073820.1 helix-turn-helix domain-containing protein [Vibrio parahaemolyticus]EGQ9133250.1 helix-turn-helix domain-containing protein [Vibrio parahaemolyticus]EGQ9286466.1 helix-turn-helix transcriptional regulator [Vibrio parahaemolyticus]